MKILCIILLVLGALVAFLGPKIAKKVLKTQTVDQSKKIVIKSIGLVIVVIAALIAFVS